MPIGLLISLCVVACLGGGIIIFFVCCGEYSDYSLKKRIGMVILSILIPLSLFSWIKIAPLPAPVETIYPIIADPNNNCCISYIENVYVNVNAVAKQQVDPNKHMLKVTNHTGWSGGIYWDSHPTTYSLVNKNLEKGN